MIIVIIFIIIVYYLLNINEPFVALEVSEPIYKRYPELNVILFKNLKVKIANLKHEKDILVANYRYNKKTRLLDINVIGIDTESGWDSKNYLLAVTTDKHEHIYEVPASHSESLIFNINVPLEVTTSDFIDLDYTQNIPKKIFQTESLTRYTLLKKQTVVNLIKQNPEYNYTYFDDDLGYKFIQEHFSSDVLTAFVSVKPGSFKADLLRYCVLYIHGGVYLDCKSIPLVPFRDFIKPHYDFLIVRDALPDSIYNAFIAITPKHKLMFNAIAQSVRNINKKSYGNSILDITGPKLLGRVVNQYFNRNENTYFEVGEKSNYEILVHNSLPEDVVSWGIRNSKRELLMLKQSKKIIHTSLYAGMWNQKNVY